MNRTDVRAFVAPLGEIRRRRPLVHNVTNLVVMPFTANALLAVGASPVMAHAPEEVAEFAAMAGAIVVNMGTVDRAFLEGMEAAARAASAAGRPWAFDPVGVGATAWRREVGRRLMALRPTVVRGNAGEIMALAGGDFAGQGVDSLAGSDAAVTAARRLSAESGVVVAVTGATDYVVAGDRVSAIAGGNPMSQQVTGTGCATTALVGAFLAVAPPEEAAAAALALMKHAAEAAVAVSSGPGTFAAQLLDALAAA
jgi:hydroxyethylthiazole kinase